MLAGGEGIESLDLEDYLDEMKHSERNRMIELAVLLRFVMISLSSDL